MSAVQQLILSTGTTITPVTTSYATWNPNDVSSGSFSNSNRTVTFSAQGGTRSQISKVIGKWYIECTATSIGGSIASFGIANSSYLTTNGIAGTTASGSCGYSSDGRVYNNGSITTVLAYTNGDIIGMAIDMAASIVTFYKNNVSVGSYVVRLTNETYIYAGANGAGPALTINAGQSAFTYSVPAGYISGLYQSPTLDQQQWTIPGTYTWVAPTGVSSPSVLCVSAGDSQGSGGSLAYGNSIAITPGNSYTIKVGDVGAGTPTTTESYFSSTSVLKSGGATATSAQANAGTALSGGGLGGARGSPTTGAGGGGAGGYSGNGGAGGYGGGPPQAGFAGAGGGGSGGTGGDSGIGYLGGGGGGVGILGEGTSGPAPNGTPYGTNGFGGSGGLNGTAGLQGGRGGNFGGGGGSGSTGVRAGTGAVRIIWGSGRTFPASQTGNIPPTNVEGQVEFTAPGTYNWTVPTGVTSISVVAVQPGSNTSTTAAATTVTYNSVIVCRAQNGNRIGDGGGDGGAGGSGVFYGGAGGGAGGYSGNGGAGAAGGSVGAGSSGSGGGGAGGGINSDTSNCGGGGVGLSGLGRNGVGIESPTGTFRGGGGSNGSTSAPGSPGVAGVGGAYGGGAGAASSATPGGAGGALSYKSNISVTPGQVVTLVIPATPANAGAGACRIMWGYNRAYPSTNTTDYAVTNYPTWSPVDKSVQLTLSNSDLTVITGASGSYNNIRGTVGKISGKWYYEVTMGASASVGIGFANLTAALSGSNYFGADTNSVAMYANGGVYYNGGNSGSGTLLPFTSGSVVGIALNLDARTITVSVDGVQGIVSSSLPTGTLYPGWSASTAGNTSTINFGAAPFKYGPPAGYSPFSY